jgi:hypothetical protein
LWFPILFSAVAADLPLAVFAAAINVEVSLPSFFLPSSRLFRLPL